MMLRNGVADMMIRVHDTGIGMEPAFISRIFRPFKQETVETSRKYGGTGLGMAITRNIVEMMGGTINVQTEKNRGTEFIICLPMRTTGRAPARWKRSPSWRA